MSKIICCSNGKEYPSKSAAINDIDMLTTYKLKKCLEDRKDFNGLMFVEKDKEQSEVKTILTVVNDKTPIDIYMEVMNNIIKKCQTIPMNFIPQDLPQEGKDVISQSVWKCLSEFVNFEMSKLPSKNTTSLIKMEEEKSANEISENEVVEEDSVEESVKDKHDDYKQMDKADKTKLLFNEKMHQMFPNYEEGKEWDETEDIKNFDIDEWKTRHAKTIAEQSKKQEKEEKPTVEELPIPEMSIEANRVEIEICNNKDRLHQIIDVCNGVLAKISHNKKVRHAQYADVSDLKLIESDIFVIKDMAVKRMEYLDNPQDDSQQIEFQWNSAEQATNEMWLDEISRYDEMMCQSAREAHERDLKRYNEALEQGTNRESEFKARKAFEEQFLAKLKVHEQNLINQRIDLNTDYENRNFGFTEFENLKKKLEQNLEAVLGLKMNATNVEKVKNSICVADKNIELANRELNDCITPDGIVYNKYALSMWYRIKDVMSGKLNAYENDEDFVEEQPNEKIRRAIHSIEDMIFKLTHGNTCAKLDLQDKKERLYKKINQKDEFGDRWFVSALCVAYRLVDSHLQAAFD